MRTASCGPFPVDPVDPLDPVSCTTPAPKPCKNICFSNMFSENGVQNWDRVAWPCNRVAWPCNRVAWPCNRVAWLGYGVARLGYGVAWIDYNMTWLGKRVGHEKSQNLWRSGNSCDLCMATLLKTNSDLLQKGMAWLQRKSIWAHKHGDGPNWCTSWLRLTHF